MFKFFDQVGDSIAAVFEFIVNIFKNLFSLFEIIGTSFGFVIEVAQVLPGPVKGGILAMIGVSVILLLLGRN